LYDCPVGKIKALNCPEFYVDSKDIQQGTIDYSAAAGAQT